MNIYEIVQKFYEGAVTEKRVIGRSAFGRKLYAVKTGEGTPVGIAQYAIHGREFITAKLAVEQYRIGVKKGSCWFVPLVNPDGALLSEVGPETIPKTQRKRLAEQNGGEDFSLWKANGNGVDLNVNFDADWGNGAKNARIPGAENYIGKQPFSEPESRALKRFTLRVRPDYTLSYHTKGEEIYWYFYQAGDALERDRALAEALSKATGYPLAYAKGSVGGYKDWCIERLGIPSFTIETGSDAFRHPLDDGALENILQHNAYSLYEWSTRLK